MSQICFSDKIRLEISNELSAKQTIYMKCQVLFSLNNDYKNIMSSAKSLPTSLGVNCLLMVLWIFPYPAQYFLALFTFKASITTIADYI